MATKICLFRALSKTILSRTLVPSVQFFNSCSRLAVTNSVKVCCHCRSMPQSPATSSYTHTSLSVQRNYSSERQTSSIWQRMGFTGRLKYKKYILRRSALKLYLCCVELPDYNSMMQDLHLSDTFNSWFRLVELHVWLSMVRLSSENREGKFIRNVMVTLLWEDVNKKSKKLGELASYTSRMEGLQQLADQFKASLYAYDEGLMADDIVLAGALWRNLFDKNCADVSHLELMVEYVRKQLSHLDSLDSGPLLSHGLVTFLPLHETPDSIQRHNQILDEIAKRI